MSTELTIEQKSEYWKVTPHGIEIQAGLDHEVWKQLAQAAFNHYEDTQLSHVQAMFIIGDILTYGEREYGELYADAVDATRKFIRKSMKTIQNAAWIAKSVPADVRHIGTLTLAHHEVVAALQVHEQRAYLDQADENEWTVSELKKKVKAASKGEPTEEEPKTKKKTVVLDTEDEAGLVHAFEKCMDYLDSQPPADEWSKEKARAWFPPLKKIIKKMAAAEPIALECSKAATAYLAGEDLSKWSAARKAKWSIAEEAPAEDPM